MAFAAGSIGLSSLVGPRRANSTKLTAYNSYTQLLSDLPGIRLSVKPYLVAKLVLAFNVEAMFVYLRAVVLRGAQRRLLLNFERG